METDVFPRMGREEFVPLFEALIKLLGNSVIVLSLGFETGRGFCVGEIMPRICEI